MERTPIEELLRQRIGLDAASVGPALLRRAELARMRNLGIADNRSSSYHDLLKSSETELQALIEEVVIPESWFFRDEIPFSLLGEIADRWIKEPSRAPFRALSIPCAGGEEPYSMAITLLDRGLPADRFRIDAVDLSGRSLNMAKRGHFAGNSFRTVDLSFRDRHFTTDASGFQLKDQTRALVRFQPGNILDGNLLAGESPYDVVFCRNLLIYFDRPARLRAAETIDRLLANEGVLFVGHAEQAGVLGTKFRAASMAGSFAYVRREKKGSEPTHPSAKSSPLKPRGSPFTAGARTLPSADADRRVSTTKAVSVIGDGELSTASVLSTAAKLADEGRYEEAAAHCENEIRRHGPCPRTLYLLGVISQARGLRDEAEAFFQKTVYLDPHHAEALLSLALMAQRRGDHPAAANFKRRAGRASKEKASG